MVQNVYNLLAFFVYYNVKLIPTKQAHCFDSLIFFGGVKIRMCGAIEDFKGMHAVFIDYHCVIAITNLLDTN